MPDDLGSRIARLRAIFEDLPPLQRDVFELHCIEDLRFEDIAVRLSVSIEAVRQALAAALVTIDRRLEERWARPVPDVPGAGRLP